MTKIRLKTFLINNPVFLKELLLNNNSKFLIYNLSIILICSGLYAASVGLWRSPLQAFYVGIKFPLLIFLVVFGNAFINWILSQSLGFKVTFRQSINIILYGFSVSSLILFSLIPVVLFVLINTPSPVSANSELGVSVMTVVTVLFISISGIISNIRLYSFLAFQLPQKIALLVLSVWLFINLFLGAQISWNLRPFIGTPDRKVEFIRKNAFKGTFYEDMAMKIKKILLDKEEVNYE